MDENILEVKCGDVEGVLHKLAFCCPGIRQPCIEVNGEMITPKTFITMGNKQSLKNWKSAIRHNGIPLRKLMENGNLEFFEHHLFCTGRCSSKESRRRQDNDDDEEPGQTVNDNKILDEFTLIPQAAYLIEGTHNDDSPITIKMEKDVQEVLVIDADCFADTASESEVLRAISNESNKTFYSKINSNDKTTLKRNRTNNDVAKFHLDYMPEKNIRKFVNETDDSAGNPKFSNYMNRLVNSCNGSQNVTDVDIDSLPDIVEDSEIFWQAVQQVGLLDDFVREIKRSIETLKEDIKSSSSSNAHTNLSKLVTNLDLVATLKYKLIAHREEVEENRCRSVKYNGPKSLINASEYSKRKLNDSNIQQQTNGTNHSATEKRKRLQPRKIRQEETYSNNFMDCSDTDSEDTR